jgi:hypothetical protein
MSDERYSPGFLTNEEKRREQQRTAEMVHGLVERSLESAKENGSQTNQKRPLKSFALKVKKNARIDVQLKEGLFDESNHASYITVSIYREGNKASINMKKAQASQLSLLLSQLVAEGNNFDYQRLKNKYPNQESWHVY